jgi:Zinc finger, C3HC4 type (RING finger)
MGKKFSTLKKIIAEANNIFGSENYFRATGMKLKFSMRGKVHVFRLELNEIIVEQIVTGNNLKLIGRIHPEKIQNAVRIGEHILSVYSLRPKTISEDTICCICLDRSIDVLLMCGHGYCEKDINDWETRGKNCPLCRQTLHDDQMYSSLDNLKEDNEIQISIDQLLNLFIS